MGIEECSRRLPCALFLIVPGWNVIFAMNVFDTSAQFSALFVEGCNHVPVRLSRLPEASVLWLNRRAVVDDPHFAALGNDEEAYCAYLLKSCAFQVCASSNGSADAIGFADRYGGAGIGHNGGSGRGVFVGQYQIKGVGRTPLVSRLTKLAYASGGAYLEECVRESIFSEIVAAEFPCGAVPVLAIIDTGLVQIWDTQTGPKRERRTLLVRPHFLRPAHFQRAIGFVADNVKEGAQDHVRVEKVFEMATKVFGRELLLGMYEHLWLSWAAQLAHSFVHRMPLGNNTISNISFDGRLVDFGAMSAVPSWANTVVASYPSPFKNQFNVIENSIRSLSHYFGRHLNSDIGTLDNIEYQIAKARQTFQRVICHEVLCLSGVQEDISSKFSSEIKTSRVWAIVHQLIVHYQAEQVDLTTMTSDLKVSWDFDQVWSKRPPLHLRALRILLDSLVTHGERAITREFCKLISQSRTELYAPSMKSYIYHKLDADLACSFADDRLRVRTLIGECVQSSTRLPRACNRQLPVGIGN